MHFKSPSIILNFKVLKQFRSLYLTSPDTCPHSSPAPSDMEQATSLPPPKHQTFLLLHGGVLATWAHSAQTLLQVARSARGSQESRLSRSSGGRRSILEEASFPLFSRVPSLKVQRRSWFPLQTINPSEHQLLKDGVLDITIAQQFSLQTWFLLLLLGLIQCESMN